MLLHKQTAALVIKVVTTNPARGRMFNLITRRIIITQTMTTIRLRVTQIVTQVSQVLVLKIIRVVLTTTVAVTQYIPDQKVDSITTTVMGIKPMFLKGNYSYGSRQLTATIFLI